MQFRLTYAGCLLAERSDRRIAKERSLHVHDIRKKFHKQLKLLWASHAALKDWEAHDKTIWMFPHFQREGFDWLPIVNRQNGLICNLEILMLRSGEPGNVLWDIDNKLKTLFDALRMPSGPDELGRNSSKGQQKPDADESPFYVLLENDNLITHVAVTSDMLLEPVPGVLPGQAARLIVGVTIRPYNVHLENLGCV